MHFSSVGRADIGDDSIDLMAKMLSYNPDKRITAQQCLLHPFFNDVPPYLKDLSRQKTLGRNRNLVNSRNQGRNMQPDSPIDDAIMNSSALNRESKISQIMQKNSDLNHLNMNDQPSSKWNMPGGYSNQTQTVNSPYLQEKPYNLVSSSMAFKENSMLSSYGESLAKQPYQYNSQADISKGN